MSRAGASAATRIRIIDGAARCIAERGTAEASLSAIAGASGVSKALLHYHYADRATLLAEVVTTLTERVTERERVATDMDVASGSASVDALWAWLRDELARGEVRAILELGLLRDRAVREASTMAAARRHAAATQTVQQLFERLGLEPTLPASLLGQASLAFVDGLAAASIGAPADPRVSFDVFWFALLGLAE